MSVTLKLKHLKGSLKGFVEVVATDPDGIKDVVDRQHAWKKWASKTTVGRAVFLLMSDGTYRASMVEVLDTYKRQGLATKMYQLVQQKLKKPIMPSSDQTEEGVSFWVGLRKKGSLLSGLMPGCA